MTNVIRFHFRAFLNSFTALSHSTVLQQKEIHSSLKKVCMRSMDRKLVKYSVFFGLKSGRHTNILPSVSPLQAFCFVLQN